jgi:hypothetical protein
MANTYTISRWTFTWMKKLFFHLLDLIVWNSYIILHSCSSKLSTGTFDSAWLGTSYSRVEGSLVLKLYHRECQPFHHLARSQTHSDLARERDKVKVSCSAQKKQSKTIYMPEIQHIVCCAMFQDKPFEIHVLTPTHIGRSDHTLLSTTFITYWYLFIPTKYCYIFLE